MENQPKYEDEGGIFLLIIGAFIFLCMIIPAFAVILLRKIWEVVTFNNYCKKHKRWVKKEIRGYPEDGFDKLYCPRCDQ